MRICYLCPDLGIPLGGEKGASAHVRGLVQAFKALNQDVLVVSPAPEGGMEVGAPVFVVPATDLAANLRLNRNRPLQRALRHLLNNVTIERAIEEVFARHKPDLIYERYSPFGVAGGVVAARFKIPHFLEVNAPLAWEGSQYRRQALTDVAQALENSAFASASRIIAVSRELCDQLVAQGVARSKIEVVPNGVHPNRFRPRAGARGNGLAGRFVIGFIGSLKPWHGIEVIASAFRTLAGDDRMHLLVVGEGPMAKVVNELAAEFPAQVTFVGAVPHDDVAGYLHSMDVALAPYPPLERFYYSPLKVLEYMAAGRAIVASRIGQVAELIEDGKTGLLVPPGDADALVSAIRRLAENKALRAALGRSAAAEAKRAHNWTHRARKILELAAASDPAVTGPRPPFVAPVGEPQVAKRRASR